MATTSKTIYTHTCDLCGTEQPRAELRRLGDLLVDEGRYTGVKPSIRGKTVDICPACQAQPIADVIAMLDDQPERDQFGNVTNTVAIKTRST